MLRFHLGVIGLEVYVIDASRVRFWRFWSLLLQQLVHFSGQSVAASYRGMVERGDETRVIG